MPLAQLPSIAGVALIRSGKKTFRGSEEGTGLFCDWCRKHSRRPKKVGVGKATWIDLPCTTITRQSLVRHSKSECHVTATKMEVDLASAKKCGGIERAFDQVVSAEKKAFIGALKCMYWLNKSEIAHTTNFSPLLDLCKSLGVSYLEDMTRGQNAKYASERFMQEGIQALAEVVSRDIVESLQASPFFALCVDETTDVSITKQLIVYCRYVVEREVKTSFLRIAELPNGLAVTISEKIIQICSELQLDLNKFCGLGSDGASVMLGVRGGVSALLKQHVPFLVSNHCIAHRLALACGQAANEIAYLKRFKDLLDQLYRYYEKSPVRMAGLKAIQEVLNDPQLKLTQAKDVRWLSHEKAVSNLRRCLPSVITSLEREAEKRNCAQAAGLVGFIKQYKFVASLYMLSDVLPPLANLSRAFQKKDVDFTVIKPLVQGTKATIDSLSMTPGQYFQSLPAIIPELRQYGVHQPSDHEVQNFKANVYDKYLIVLSRNITGRFPDVALLEGFGIFDPVGLSNNLTLHATHGAENLRVLTDHYGRDGVVNVEGSQVELKTFNSIVASSVPLKTMTTRQLMSHVLKTEELCRMFPILAKLAAIGLLLPLSTVDCERGFSTLPRVKTDLRNRLINKTLNHLLVISIEGPNPADYPYEQACSLWASWRNRRIQVNA